MIGNTQTSAQWTGGCGWFLFLLEPGADLGRAGISVQCKCRDWYIWDLWKRWFTHEGVLTWSVSARWITEGPVGFTSVSHSFLLRTAVFLYCGGPLEWPFTAGAVLIRLFWVMCAVLGHFRTVWPGMFASVSSLQNNPECSPFIYLVSLVLLWNRCLLTLVASTLLIKADF